MAQPMEKFFGSIDLLEKLMPFLPSNSIISLAETCSVMQSSVLHLLRRSTVWEKLVKRTLGLGDYTIRECSIYMPDEYWGVVEERVEEEMVKIHPLLLMVQLMEAEKKGAGSGTSMQHLLNVISGR